MTRARVLFHVQHLLGIGHLKRAACLARAMEGAGFSVTIVSGGHEVPGLDIGNAAFVQLSPMRAADVTFKSLVGADDREVGDELRFERRDRLLETFATLEPDIIVTELFPFGRRALRHELLPLLNAAKARARPPAIVCSVRDILVPPSKPIRTTQMLALAREYFDLVLVHGDPTLIPFERTFPLAHEIADRIRHTGYVVDPPSPGLVASGIGAGEVIVSAGGGALSEPLLRAALAARAMTTARDRTWRLLAGPSLPESVFRDLTNEAEGGIIVERARPDFTAMLPNCHLSISQGGYNTVMDVLAARCRAVIAPYAGGKETEQTLRAELLAGRGALQLLHENALGPETLAEAVADALTGPEPTEAALDTGGAAASARALRELVDQRTGTA
ncbi:MAG: glycosyltransferase [Alphaproteobacteria bacterium]